MKVGPMLALFEIKIGPIFEILFTLQIEEDFSKQIKHKNNFANLKFVQFCCATYLDQYLTLTWPSV